MTLAHPPQTDLSHRYVITFIATDLYPQFSPMCGRTANGEFFISLELSADDVVDSAAVRFLLMRDLAHRFSQITPIAAWPYSPMGPPVDRGSMIAQL